MESFRELDRNKMLREFGDQIWQDIRSGKAEQDPSLLCRFLLTSFADLKKYSFVYWFAFPALKGPAANTVQEFSSLSDSLNYNVAQEVAAKTTEWLASFESRPAFWLLNTADACNTESFVVLPLSQGKHCSCEKAIICLMDPNNEPAQPGWPLRNMLLLAAFKWRWRKAAVICWRTRGGRLSLEHSRLLEVTLPQFPDESWNEDTFVPETVGWEPNSTGRLGVKRANLASSLDPVLLADQAANLNLNLMKWRAAPSLDVPKLANTKCLLLGAGTLGCAVARTLLGWGVKQITLLDNSKVSYSNPVRQSLYEFTDCVNNAPKAEAAAKKLQQISPSVLSKGIQLTIPMPGHPLSPSEYAEAEAAANQLENLIKSHDVVFLLMDTRESRWLPTLLATTHNKLVINAALGFDSYMVMRHGAAPAPGVDDKSRLGCYYCNDVIAPKDSTVDRTLDQQCTVARPGLAPIAGALAAEMMAAAVQHPLGINAPADTERSREDDTKLPLGAVPHMIRGQISSFTQMKLQGQAFSQCTACSSKVVKLFRSDGWSWLLKALQDPKELEDVTGLTELMNKTAESYDIDEPDGGLETVDSDEFVEIL